MKKKKGRVSVPKERHPQIALLLVLAFVSGASALIYETIWIRWFRLLFGNTAYAATATLCAFFAGLAIGAAFFGHLAAKTRSPLRTYAWIELGVAGTALWVPVAIAFYDPIYAVLYESLADQRAVFVAVKFALALGAMLPTSILLGGTLPMLATALSDKAFSLGRQGTRLYAVNTLGAAIGAAGGALLLPEWIGVPMAYAVGIAATLAIAIVALQLGKRGGHAVPAAQQSPPVKERAPLDALLIAFGSGFGVLATEVLLIHGLGQLFTHSAYSFGTVLMVVLASLGISAACVSAATARFGTANLLRTAIVLSAILLFMMPSVIRAIPSVGAPSVSLILRAFGLEDYWIAIIVVISAAFPLFIVAGMIFPLTFRLASGGLAGPRIGGLLAANTVGGILGAISASFLFLAHVGLWNSWGWLAFLYAAAALLVPGRRPARVVTAAAVAAFIAAVWMAPVNPWRLPLVTLAESETLIDVKEGPHGVVSVVEGQDGNRRIKIDDRYEFGSSKQRAAYERMGHLPLLLHSNPERVAFVGSATGGVAAAAVLHPVQSIDLIEIVPEVHELAAKHFAFTNRGVHNDPRSRLVQEDGRNHLRATPDLYDVIVEDVFVPYRPSAAAMYSRDHYQDVKDRLTENGVFCQYLPVYQLSDETLNMIAAAFAEVFPEGTLWRPQLRLHIPVIGLVGFRGPAPSAAAIEHRTGALKALGVEDRWVTHPRGIWLLYMGPVVSMFDGAPSPPIHSDSHPRFEFVVARDLPGEVSRYRYSGWPELAASLQTRAERRDTFFIGRPKGLFRAANTFVRVNLAYEAGNMDAATEAWREVQRSVPAELLSPPDNSFSDVWAD